VAPRFGFVFAICSSPPEDFISDSFFGYGARTPVSALIFVFHTRSEGSAARVPFPAQVHQKIFQSPASVPAWALPFFSPIQVFTAWLRFWCRLICYSPAVPHSKRAHFLFSVCVVLDFHCLGCDSRFSWPPDFLTDRAAILVSLRLRSYVAGARFGSPYSIFLCELFVSAARFKVHVFQRWKGRVCVV
jgi:hypothetical protein